jgi:Tol biopolymer transport system component
VWTLEEDGTNLTRVPVGDPPREALFYPSWYADGDRIAVTDYEARQVLTVSTSTGEVQALTDPEEIWAGMPAAAPVPQDRDVVAFAGQAPGGTYAAGKNGIWVTTGSGDSVPLDREHGRTPSWSPVAERLAFSSDRRRPGPVSLLHARSLPGGTTAIYVASEIGSANQRIDPVSPLDHLTIHPKGAPD